MASIYMLKRRACKSIINLEKGLLNKFQLFYNQAAVAQRGRATGC